MRHRVKSTRLNRDRAHLDSMLKNMATSVILYEKVKTTKPKAKLVKPQIERIISMAKKTEPFNAMRRMNSYFSDENASKKVMNELLKRYKDRPSGFVRITALGHRPGDAAPMVQIELV